MCIKRSKSDILNFIWLYTKFWFTGTGDIITATSSMVDKLKLKILVRRNVRKTLERQRDWGDGQEAISSLCELVAILSLGNYSKTIHSGCTWITTCIIKYCPDQNFLLKRRKIIDTFHLRNHSNSLSHAVLTTANERWNSCFNTQAGEQTFVWMGKFKNIVCAMWDTSPFLPS